MSTTIKKLNMTFGSAAGNKKISLDDPLDTLDSETVANAMNEVLALETMLDSKGNLLTDAVAAEVQETITTTLF